jgi:hypothetical protein
MAADAHGSGLKWCPSTVGYLHGGGHTAADTYTAVDACTMADKLGGGRKWRQQPKHTAADAHGGAAADAHGGGRIRRRTHTVADNHGGGCKLLRTHTAADAYGGGYMAADAHGRGRTRPRRHMMADTHGNEHKHGGEKMQSGRHKRRRMHTHGGHTRLWTHTAADAYAQ